MTPTRPPKATTARLFHQCQEIHPLNASHKVTRLASARLKSLKSMQRLTGVLEHTDSPPLPHRLLQHPPRSGPCRETKGPRPQRKQIRNKGIPVLVATDFDWVVGFSPSDQTDLQKSSISTK